MSKALITVRVDRETYEKILRVRSRLELQRKRHVSIAEALRVLLNEAFEEWREAHGGEENE